MQVESSEIYVPYCVKYIMHIRAILQKSLQVTVELSFCELALDSINFRFFCDSMFLY